MTKLLTSLALIVACQVSTADVYRWTDENGKVHFGDRPPPATETKAIDTPIVNSDSSARLNRPLTKMLDQERQAQADKQKQRQAKQAESKKRQQALCQKARKKLKTFKGRVAFVKKDGSEVKVSENERRKLASNLEKQIRKNCKN